MSDDARVNLLAQIEDTKSHVVAISAQTGAGIDGLLGTVEDILAESGLELSIKLTPSEGQAMAWLYRNSEVLERTDDESGVLLQVRIDAQNKGQFEQKFGKGRLIQPS